VAIFSPSTARANQLKFSATLSPASEVPAVMTEGSATGTVTVTLDVTTDYYGMTTASAQFDVALNNFPTNHNVVLAHIHQGSEGMNGAVVIDTGVSPMSPIPLTSGGAAFSKTSIMISPDTARAIMANPSQFYFNVHTDANMGGAIRGQLAPADSTNSTVVLGATLLPANETTAVTGGDTAITGTGKAVFSLTKDAGGNITAASAVLSFTINNVPSTDTIILSHIHTGASGVAGPVLVDSGLTPGAALMATNGTATFTSGSVSVSPANAQAIISNPAGFYFNVHSSLNGGGAARGQLFTPQSSTVELDANLLPSNETTAVTGGDTAITGTAKAVFTLDKDPGGNILDAAAVLSFTINNVPASDTVILAHIHTGAAGVAGPVLVDSGLTPGAGLTPTSGTATFASASVTVSPANAQAILSNPAGFYFNVHTSLNGGGAARGQLVNPAQTTASTATFAAHLLPGNEVPPVTNGDSVITGDVIVILTLNKDATGTIQSASTEFDYTLNNVPASDMIILSHVHNAAAGSNGPVRIDSGITPGTALTPTNGTVTFSKNTLTTSPSVAADLVANPGNYYFNVHSNVNPGGAARGQLEVAPLIVTVTAQGKNLIVTGTGFTAGAQILVNASPVNVTKQVKGDTTTLTGKKAAKQIASGQTVQVQVQLADGVKGPGVNFVKP